MSKIHLAAEIASVTEMMQLMSCNCIAWLIPYLMNNLASMKFTLVA